MKLLKGINLEIKEEKLSLSLVLQEAENLPCFVPMNLLEEATKEGYL